MATVMRMQGLHKVLKNLNTAIKQIEGRTEAGLIRGSIEVRRQMEHSTPKIPVDTGNLRASWFVVTSAPNREVGFSAPNFRTTSLMTGEDRNVDIGSLTSQHNEVKKKYDNEVRKSKQPALIMGFTANYAAPVHEMVGANFQREGAGAKFLEEALHRSTAYIIKMLWREAKFR